jgi:hypothetical protein
LALNSPVLRSGGAVGGSEGGGVGGGQRRSPRKPVKASSVLSLRKKAVMNRNSKKQQQPTRDEGESDTENVDLEGNSRGKKTRQLR